MTTLTEGKYPSEFIVSEMLNAKSRTLGATLISGQNLDAGTVLGIITASGKYTQFDQDAATGEEAAAGILISPVDATDGDMPCVVLNWAADVNGDELTWPSDIDAGEKTAAIAELEALKIRVLDGV